MLWYKGLQNTIYCDTLVATSYRLYWGIKKNKTLIIRRTLRHIFQRGREELAAPRSRLNTAASGKPLVRDTR